MKTIILAFFAACVIGSTLAQDCSAKFKDFHQCLENNHKKAEADGKAKFEAMKPKIAACYTDNGCTAPAKPQKGKGGSSGAASGERRNSTAGDCRKALGEAMKANFEDCIKKAVPGFSFPQKDAQQDKPHFGGHKGFNHKDDNKALDGCAKKQAVRDCIRGLFNSSKPSEDEKKAHFKAACDAKQTCLTALGADCQAQMEKFKQAACQCRQQQRQQVDQIRSSVKACASVQEKNGKQNQGKDQKQQSCEEKDYCKLGYDAFVQDHQKVRGAKGPAHQ